jgi:hypothetical protein
MSEDDVVIGKCHTCDEDVRDDDLSSDAKEAGLTMHVACVGPAHPYEQPRGFR